MFSHFHKLALFLLAAWTAPTGATKRKGGKKAPAPPLPSAPAARQTLPGSDNEGSNRLGDVEGEDSPRSLGLGDLMGLDLEEPDTIPGPAGSTPAVKGPPLVNRFISGGPRAPGALRVDGDGLFKVEDSSEDDSPAPEALRGEQHSAPAAVVSSLNVTAAEFVPGGGQMEQFLPSNLLDPSSGSSHHSGEGATEQPQHQPPTTFDLSALSGGASHVPNDVDVQGTTTAAGTNDVDPRQGEWLTEPTMEYGFFQPPTTAQLRHPGYTGTLR